MRKTHDVPHPVRIIRYQVDNLPNTSSSFRIVCFRSLVFFLLLLSLGFIYQKCEMKKNEVGSGKNLLLESLLVSSFLSLLVTPEKSFRLSVLS
jgi:hypothetical protein